jgi:integrase
MEEWNVLRRVITSKWIGNGACESHVLMAVNLLQDTIRLMFDSDSLGKLCEAQVNMHVLLDYAQKINALVESRGWQRTTAHKVLCALRSILKRTHVPPAFVRATKLYALPACESSFVLGKKNASLPLDTNKRMLLDSWVAILRRRFRSAVTIRYCLDYIVLTAVPKLGLDLNAWPKDPEDLRAIALRCNDAVVFRDLVGKGYQMHQKWRWVDVFVREILRTDVVLDKDLVKKTLREWQLSCPQDFKDGTDLHRISKQDLEKLHKQAIKHELDELLFMTLLTTGMRIGGFVKMKCADVAEMKDGKWNVLAQGKTLEKGSKIFSFKMHERVQTLLGIWLNKRRPLCMSEYVFPGKMQGRPMAQQTFRLRFRNMCKACNLSGPQYHPHALRHCYVHILLELGNSMDTVAKMINHSNSATTAKYYGSESAAQATERAIVPWLNRAKPDPVPDFLAGTPNPSRLAIAEQVLARLH